MAQQSHGYYAALAKKFILYLVETNALQNYTILKRKAGILFSSFRKQYGIKRSFGFFFKYLVKYLTPIDDNGIMMFKPIKLHNLLTRSTSEELEVKPTPKVVKKTIVSQSIAFKADKPTEVLLCNTECKFCNVVFKDNESFKLHVDSKEHIFRTKFFSFINEKNNKNHILEVNVGEFALDKIILRKNIKKSITVHLHNKINENIQVDQVELWPTSSDITILLLTKCPITLKPLSKTDLIISVTPISDGIIYIPLLLLFKRRDIEEFFATELILNVHDEILDDLHPSEPFQRSKPVIIDFIEPTDLGKPPSMEKAKKPVIRLKNYAFSSDLKTLLNKGFKDSSNYSNNQKILCNKVLSLLNVKDKFNCLTPYNYTELLDFLLFFEEHQLLKDIRDYDCENQEIIKLENSPFFTLSVPGLAEQRPSVLVGDIVTVKFDKKDTKVYGGFVHQVQETTVSLDFSENFKKLFQNKMKFYVSFSFNRYPLRTEHQALELTKSDNISEVFFPEKIINKVIPSKIDLNWFDARIGNNRQQQEAVYAVLNNFSKPYPYLIFGPPGTGKTSTVVEAIKQIHKSTNKNILVCAPSNSGANLIAQRLVTSIPTTDLIRYIAFSYPKNQIPKEIIKYCNYDSNNHYQLTKDEITKYRIVVTTLVNAAKLVNFACPKNHFGYVFIDESGQATETETLIPIAGILSSNGTLNGQVVLAGDPKQLGPIIHSKLALEYGFGTSMLERLMNTLEAYQKKKNKYNSSAVTKLLLNYRSHRTIIKNSNELFYDNELKPAGDVNMINCAVNASFLPNKKIPIIFHNVEGVDAREAKSPSFFNIQEVDVVLKYVEQLLDSKLSGRKVTPPDIGIISPYKKQIEKIRKGCEKKLKGYKNWQKMTLGTVEQFQGQERLIIIISTVRSKPEFLKFDNKFHLGFLKNPKRFNVAMTRAKALLIVIGNANILQNDEYWKTFLKYCLDNNAISGKKFSIEENVSETMIKAFENLGLNDNNNTADGPDFSRGKL